jgi:hypothetical protein
MQTNYDSAGQPEGREWLSAPFRKFGHTLDPSAVTFRHGVPTREEVRPLGGS